MSAEGRNFWGVWGHAPWEILKLDSLKRHFLRSLGRISLHMTGMIIRFQLYELH